MRVYKYPLKNNLNILNIPKGSKPLFTKVVDGELCLWMLVTVREITEFRFCVFNTGDFIPDYVDHPEWLEYVGTVFFQVKGVVQHVFMEKQH